MKFWKKKFFLVMKSIEKDLSSVLLGIITGIQNLLSLPYELLRNLITTFKHWKREGVKERERDKRIKKREREGKIERNRGRERDNKQQWEMIFQKIKNRKKPVIVVKEQYLWQLGHGKCFRSNQMSRPDTHKNETSDAVNVIKELWGLWI